VPSNDSEVVEVSCLRVLSIRVEATLRIYRQMLRTVCHSGGKLTPRQFSVILALHIMAIPWYFAGLELPGGLGGFNPPSKFFDHLLIIACYRLSPLAAYGQPPQLFFSNSNTGILEAVTLSDDGEIRVKSWVCVCS